MKIGILGTGVVGQTIGTKLIELGHEVKLGSRGATSEASVAWLGKHPTRASTGTFAEAAQFGELLVNATKGEATVEAFTAAGQSNATGKTVIDISNPLDFSKGFPPMLFTKPGDSLAETLQRACPWLKVVKALNTMTASVMVSPRQVSKSHDVFLASDDESAKEQVRVVLEQFGWGRDEMVDLGPLSGARAAEALLLPWVHLYGATKNPIFGFKVVR